LKEPFWIVLYNDDSNTFNVLGPVSSDLKTTNFTAELQKYGFNIHMEAISVKIKTREDLVEEIKNRFKIKFNSKLNWVKDN